MMRRHIPLVIFAIIILVSNITGCSGSGGQTVSKLSVVVPLEYAQANTMYLEGIELAKEDISAQGINLEVVVDDDKGEFSEAVVLAQQYIADDNVIGVVGHWYSDICLSVADLYKNGSKVLIVPTVSVPTLLKNNINYVFRNIPDDTIISQVMADKAVSDGATKALIYYEDSTYGFRMSAELESYIENKGFDIIDKVREPSAKELTELVQTWNAIGYDTVFVIANVVAGYELIEYLDTNGFTGRFICSDGLDAADVSERLSGNPNLIVCSTFNDKNPPEGIKNFSERFAAKYGKEPDTFALIGYDCVMIVANAVKNGVRTTQDLNEYLSEAASLGSIYGETYFNEKHEIVGKDIYLKVYKSGELVFEQN